MWEGVALRSALGVSARAACPGASVDVFRVASDDADDGADEGGALWVRVAVDGERAFPAFAERDEASREPRDDRDDAAYRLVRKIVLRFIFSTEATQQVDVALELDPL